MSVLDQKSVENYINTGRLGLAESLINKIITIFGGSGFIGRHLIRRLTKNDYRIIVASRSPYLHGHLKPLGNPGHVELVKTNIFDPEKTYLLVGVGKKLVHNFDVEN